LATPINSIPNFPNIFEVFILHWVKSWRWDDLDNQYVPCNTSQIIIIYVIVQLSRIQQLRHSCLKSFLKILTAQEQHLFQKRGSWVDIKQKQCYVHTLIFVAAGLGS
jgi:hypothetical protein